MKTVLVNQFTGGIVSDERTPGNVVRVVTNFDTLTNPYRLVPWRDSESASNSTDTANIATFTVALRTGTTYELYGLGGASTGIVYYKDLSTGGSGDLGDNTWQTTTNNASASSITKGVFTYYKNQAAIYGIRASRFVFKYDPSGATAFGDSEKDLGATKTHFANGVVHSKDDVLYMAYDNVVISNNAGTWTSPALTLPAYLYVTSLAEYGNFLAIACAPVSGIGRSRVYLWDRNSSLTTVSETLDWSDGVIKVLEQVNGYLIGISISGVSDPRFVNRINFRLYDGARVQDFLSLNSTAVPSLSIFKQLVNQRLYFMMSITINGSVREGVWSIGSVGNKYTLYHERTPANDTALGNGALQGFGIVGDYVFIASNNNAGTAQLYKTNNVSSYTATSIVESNINPGMKGEDIIMDKKFFGAGATYAPLTSGQQVVMKYRIDGGAYVTLFTETATGKVVTEVSTAAGTPIANGREIDFRLESTGGAQITGYWYKYEPKVTLING